MRRLLEYDRETGVKTFHEYDHATKTTSIKTEQDCEPILEANKTRYNKASPKYWGIGRAARKSDFVKVASIPIGVQYKWLMDYGVDVMNKDHAGAVQKLLNLPEWRYLRNIPGRI